ncbi:MAG TPA: hypothetical protein VF237_09065, partial [Xanthobacteraceae bacterium]
MRLFDSPSTPRCGLLTRRDYPLLMGVALTKAQNWRARRSDDLSVTDRDFIDRSAARETRLKRRA